jgi:hypothetical protein
VMIFRQVPVRCPPEMRVGNPPGEAPPEAGRHQAWNDYWTETFSPRVSLPLPGDPVQTLYEWEGAVLFRSRIVVTLYPKPYQYPSENRQRPNPDIFRVQILAAITITRPRSS